MDIGVDRERGARVSSTAVMFAANITGVADRALLVGDFVHGSDG